MAHLGERKPDSAPEPLGVTPRGDGVNVAVFSANATAIEFCLFEGEREVRRQRLRGRTGNVFHDHVAGVAPGARYGLRAHGPYRPRDGHRFNPAKLLADPYARAIDRAFTLHPSMFGYRAGAPDDEASFDDTDSAPFMPKAIVPAMDGSRAAAAALTPWPRTLVYELHIRGFTARHPAIPETSRGRFAGLAHPAAIEHLTRLGVTSVEIMPSAAWIDERHLGPLGLRNYWGYNPIAMMAPDPGLAPGGWDEIRAAAAALGQAGIEVILDVVLNHSGEGDALGPTVSLRGLDNATYYRLKPGAPFEYVDDAGCGNVLALDRPAPLRLAMDSLRTWAELGGVHGFRFDLATTLGRRDNGFDPAAPLLSAISQDPLLRGLMLIAEPWDIGPGGYQVGAFPANWGEWNDRFRDDVRRFWRGDPGQLGKLATRLSGSSDLFAQRHVASRSINFVVAHDGFTLADLVSHTHKVNAANGENSRDGTDENLSWNNGAEGPSDDPSIAAARRRDQRALLATLLLARGTPMLTMGAEFGQSQGGNNNAYSQDNATSWLDWAAADSGLFAWTSHLTRLRRDHPLLRGDHFLTGEPVDVSLLPDIEWRDAAGRIMTWQSWQEPDGATLVMILAGAGETRDTTDRVTVILHRGSGDVAVILPAARAGYAWHSIADSAAEEWDTEPRHPTAQLVEEPGRAPVAEPTIAVAPRSVLVLVERPREPAGRRAADPGLLDRLARAAGIAPEWWNVDGHRTIVGDDTKRALLASMRLPAATEGEARDTLRHLSDERDRRAVPHVWVSRGEGPAMLPLGSGPGLSRNPPWLTIEREDGATQHVRAGATGDAPIQFTGADGLPAQSWNVALPLLPEGRHRVRRDDAPDLVCHLTVAPHRCFLPEAIRRGGRRFGIAAQLYALRRDGDPGIGDFTTLALLAEAAGREGAATIGINPLHMLFPGQRERASPYHPSDRRFLDPIYLDVSPAGADGPRASDAVRYPEVWALKQAILEQRFAAFRAGEQSDLDAAADFRRFVETGGVRLRRFATFQAIAEARPGVPWQHWPDGLHASDSGAVEAFASQHAERVSFHQYLQFLADRQLAAAAGRARASGLELGLFRDLAIGSAADGAENWDCSGDLAEGASIGAPPDPFTAEGQNWHLPPPLPSRLGRHGYAAFAGLLAANMRHAGVLRIDHAMGLTRLFWIPAGARGADGAYVAYPFEDLLGQVALESARANCMVVGEDLGTVPDGFRPKMTEADILSYRVLLLEREGLGFRPASVYPARAMACVTTHDLPPLAGWWEGADITERQALGLLPEGHTAAVERAAERVALTEVLTGNGALAAGDAGAPVETVVAAAHAFVASTPADVVLVQTEDLAGMRIGVNLPGTDMERPNWRLRVPVPVETLLSGGMARTILDAMRRAGRGTGGS